MNVKELYNSLKTPFDRSNPLWREAFKIYNENNSIPLHRGCKKCYFTVLNYLDKRCVTIIEEAAAVKVAESLKDNGT